MPVVRSVRPGEVDRAGEIGGIAFQCPIEEWQKAFHEFIDDFGTDSMLVVEHEGTLVSTMLLVKEGMHLGGQAVPARAVASVATVPEARRLGCAGEMMRFATRRMREWGVAASPMWPFSYAYYRKFGWEMGGEVRFMIWPRAMDWQIAPEGEISAVTEADIPSLQAVWDATSRRHRCATARVTEHWRRFLRSERFGSGREDAAGLVCRQGGAPAGYAFYNAPRAKDGEAEPPVDVAEIRAMNPAAEIALIRAMAERVPHAKFQAAFPAGHRLRSVAVNPRALETELHASFGFRVIDPEQVFPTMRTERPLDPLRLHIVDEVLGDATWALCFEGGPAIAEKTSAPPDVSLAIPTFSQIASGFLKPSDAARAGLLIGDPAAIARLDEATSTWCPPFRSGLEAG